MKLFHQKGYDAVGVAELTDALGIKPPSFYAAFGSKAGLFRRALERYTAGEANLFPNALAKGGGVAAVIARMFADAARTYPDCDGRAGCLVLYGTRNSTDPEARAMTGEISRASRAALAEFIATEAPARAEELAAFATMTLAGMSAAARDGAGREELERIAAIAGRAFARELEG